METLLRKYFALVDLAVVALCAIFAARATATAIEAGFVSGIPSVKHALKPPITAAAGPVYSKQVEEILKRNMFCSACPPILGQPEAPGVVVVPPLQRTSLPLKLLAVMYAPTDTRWSMAIIRDNDDKSVGPYGVGSKIREATIDEIDETRAYLDFGGGRREYLELLDLPAGAPAAPVAAAPAAAKDPLAEALDRGIKKTGPNSYEVQHSTLDALLGNMGALAKAARIVPEMKDGKSAGFRLLSIKPDGPFGKIGLQNGDVISAINGLEMTSPDKALEVYTKLRTANHLSVGLDRNGQKITEDYNIR
ncbi:MAG TPA: type II secretion system protein GspC [Polyangia bacterium]|jgi:general secretion pathway protein C|nr:type II secretion system protein GspC [Polyangia bacterium]